MRQSRYFTKVAVEDSEQEVEAEVHMWRAVIDQALDDFLFNSSDSYSETNYLEAKIWLRWNSADFVEVCNLALIDPELARQIIFRIVGGQDELYN